MGKAIAVEILLECSECGGEMNDYTETFRPLHKKTAEELLGEWLSYEERKAQLFAIWRFDMWLRGMGSFEEIHRKVERGELIPGVCPLPDCDCRWKHNETTKAEEG